MLFVVIYAYLTIQGKSLFGNHSIYCDYCYYLILSYSFLYVSVSFRAREALRQCLPDQLRDSTFAGCLQDDKSTKHWLTQLLKNLETGDPRAVTISPLAPQ